MHSELILYYKELSHRCFVYVSINIFRVLYFYLIVLLYLTSVYLFFLFNLIFSTSHTLLIYTNEMFCGVVCGVEKIFPTFASEKISHTTTMSWYVDCRKYKYG